MRGRSHTRLAFLGLIAVVAFAAGGAPTFSQEAGTVYYVAANEAGASDANNGLSPTHQGGRDGPWLTIQHAMDVAAAGDTILVREGTYYESGLVFAHSGEPDAPITLANDEAETVILDGSQSEADDWPGLAILPGQGHYVIQGFIIRNMPWSGIMTDSETAERYHDITIRDCILYGNGWSGIDLYVVDGFLVERVEAYDNAYYGLDIGASGDGALSSANGIVQESSFYNHTGDEGHGLAINQGHDITIRDSVAYHNAIHGFDVSDWPKFGELSHDILFERNVSYDNGVGGFAINSDSHHVTYRYNVAWANGAAWAGHGSASGFLCYEGCWHVEYVNNTSLNNTDAGFGIEDPPGAYGEPEDTLLIFHNNIAYNNDTRHLWAPALNVLNEDAIAETDEAVYEVIATYNNWSVPPGQSWAVHNQGQVYSPAEVNNGAFQPGNRSVEPGFVDATAESPDVRLRPGSPMIDAGIDVGLPFYGDAPDLGAFEYEP